MNNEIELYHGSEKSFNEFDVVYISQSLYGWGFNFTTDLDLARDYGHKIYTIEIPDDAKILDFDNNDIKEELFQMFANDIESHGISSDFIDISGTDGSFREFYWILGENYIKLLGLSRIDALKRLTELLKSFGYIGTKRGSIYVIFDKENMKIKNIRNIELQEENFSFSSISKNILKESLSQLVWHFTTLKKYYQMVDSDSIIFSEPFGYDKNINSKYGGNAQYYLSTTRVRDGRIGFSKGKNTRIELNSDYFNDRYKAGPVNYFHKRNDVKNIVNDYFNIKNSATPGTENEDRIFSNEKVITGLTKFINRVDIFLNIENEELPIFKQRYYDIFLMLRDIYNTEMGLKTFIYNEEMEFNRQGKNITDEILKIL